MNGTTAGVNVRPVGKDHSNYPGSIPRKPRKFNRRATMREGE
jgi:hypothetical protein